MMAGGMGRDCIGARAIRQGMRTSRALMSQQDRIWSRYSHDKVAIGEKLARVLRTLGRALPLHRPLRALSVGSSTEPQFRLLEAFFRGGLYLLDIEQGALDVIRDRVRRQALTHVFTLRDDYSRVLGNRARARRFREEALGGRRVALVAFEHSLYYTAADRWPTVLHAVLDEILAPTGAIHCVLMSARAAAPDTTTWLYNHFAGAFAGHRNDQDLRALGRTLRRDPRLRGAQVLTTTERVRFLVDDFQALMAVVWMILLYPHVHRYTPAQRREITRAVHRRFFARRRPLYQDQDHLVIYRGVRERGLG